MTLETDILTTTDERRVGGFTLEEVAAFMLDSIESANGTTIPEGAEIVIEVGPPGIQPFVFQPDALLSIFYRSVTVSDLSEDDDDPAADDMLVEDDAPAAV